MNPAVLSCRSLGASVTARCLSAVTSHDLYEAPLEDGDGAGSFDPGSSSTFLLSLLSIFPIFPFFGYLAVQLVVKLLLTFSGKLLVLLKVGFFSFVFSLLGNDFLSSQITRKDTTSFTGDLYSIKRPDSHQVV